MYNLLGGRSREAVRVYANGWAHGTSVEDNIRRALVLKQEGFTAAKFDPFPGPWRSFVDPKDEDYAIDFVRRLRDAVGPEFELLIEAHRRFAPSHAISIGRRLTEFGITRYEEPCLSDNIELVAEVRRAVPIPIVTGEAMYSKESFFHALERRAADILNPDICAIGGITAMMDIAAMAQPQAVVMAPHNYNSVLAGFAATVHVCGVIPNFRIAEYFVSFREACDAVATRQIKVENGWAELPGHPRSRYRHRRQTRLQARPYQEFTGNGLTEYSEEFPRKGLHAGRAGTPLMRTAAHPAPLPPCGSGRLRSGAVRVACFKHYRSGSRGCGLHMGPPPPARRSLTHPQPDQPNPKQRERPGFRHRDHPQA